MEYRKLGKSDLSVSRIGFGTMSLEISNPLSENILLRALEGGINYFDTADLYNQGMNEALLGGVFREKRDQIVLCTKVGNQWRADGSGWDWVPTKKYILSAVDQSLKRLQTDFIDLYQLHGGTLEDPIDDIIEAFELLKVAGKIRYYGISSIRPNVIREYVKRSSIISVMMQYSLLDRRPEEDMLSFLYDNQVAVLARGTIAKGLLVSKPAASYLNYSEDQVAAVNRQIIKVSSHDRSPAATAIHFVLENPAITSAVIGIRTEQQLTDALNSVQIKPPGKEELEKLKNSIPVSYYTNNR